MYTYIHVYLLHSCCADLSIEISDLDTRAKDLEFGYKILANEFAESPEQASVVRMIGKFVIE